MEMDPAARYTLRRNTASIMKISFLFILYNVWRKFLRLLSCFRRMSFARVNSDFRSGTVTVNSLLIVLHNPDDELTKITLCWERLLL